MTTSEDQKVFEEAERALDSQMETYSRLSKVTALASSAVHDATSTLSVTIENSPVILRIDTSLS